MKIAFLENVVQNHKTSSKMPSTNELNNWTEKTLSIMFPEYPELELSNIENVSNALRIQK
jgi:hypothetical protein